MKRAILVICAFVALGVGVYAAAPSFAGYAGPVTDATVTTQHSASTWQPVATDIIYTMTDTCYSIATLTGIAEMDPWDKLYIGIRADGANDSVCNDTFIVAPPPGGKGKQYVPFTITYIDSILSQTDDTDTLHVNAAVKGTGDGESVTLTNMYFHIHITDKD